MEGCFSLSTQEVIVTSLPAFCIYLPVQLGKEESAETSHLVNDGERLSGVEKGEVAQELANYWATESWSKK